MTPRMAPSADPGSVAICCRILGALFYLPPTTASTQPFFDLVRQGLLPQSWPFGTADELDSVQRLMAQGLDERHLADAYGRLFIGPDHLEAPPWGSVYLTEDGTLYGDSTLALRAFLDTEGIVLDWRINEPEDHIGLLFWAIAWLAEHQRDDALATLLDDHLRPWASTYLAQLESVASHPFYAGLARLAALTLQALPATSAPG
ncbi:MAG: Tat proofreading chaperone DmsD [Rhodocyclaceae bacterium]